MKNNNQTKNKTIYAVAMTFDIGTIYEFEIIKETPKKYIVKPLVDYYYSTPKTISKDTMICGDLKFAKTYRAAIECKKKSFLNRINRNTRVINDLTFENNELQKELRKIEEDDKNGK